MSITLFLVCVSMFIVLDRFVSHSSALAAALASLQLLR